MEDKLTSSSDRGLLFANVLNNILSDNCNLLKKLIFLLYELPQMALARIWSIARLTTRAAPLITLSKLHSI